MQTTIRHFVEAKVVENVIDQQTPGEQEVPTRIVLPFKDQRSADTVRKQLGDVSRKINVDIRPVYTSRKIKDQIKETERKPPLVNQLCAVYHFKCDLCDADYVGLTCRHLHQRINEHSQRIGDRQALKGRTRKGTKSRKILKF